MKYKSVSPPWSQTLLQNSDSLLNVICLSSEPAVPPVKWAARRRDRLPLERDCAQIRRHQYISLCEVYNESIMGLMEGEGGTQSDGLLKLRPSKSLSMQTVHQPASLAATGWVGARVMCKMKLICFHWSLFLSCRRAQHCARTALPASTSPWGVTLWWWWWPLYSESPAPLPYRSAGCRPRPPASPASGEWTACPPSWKLCHSWLAASGRTYALSGRAPRTGPGSCSTPRTG